MSQVNEVLGNFRYGVLDTDRTKNDRWYLKKGRIYYWTIKLIQGKINGNKHLFVYVFTI